MKKFIQLLFKKESESERIIKMLNERLLFEERPLQRLAILQQIQILK